MKTIIAAVVTWVAKQLIPTSWAKRKITEVLNALILRILGVLDRAAAATTFTDLDDAAMRDVREVLTKEGTVANFVDYIFALIFGEEHTPPPVDPVNPPAPPAPEPAKPGILRRLWNRISGFVSKV